MPQHYSEQLPLWCLVYHIHWMLATQETGFLQFLSPGQGCLLVGFQCGVVACRLVVESEIKPGQCWLFCIFWHLYKGHHLPPAVHGEAGGENQHLFLSFLAENQALEDHVAHHLQQRHGRLTPVILVVLWFLTGESIWKL